MNVLRGQNRLVLGGSLHWIFQAMKKSDFINKHMPVIWQDRPEDDRKKMLSDAYDLIKKGKVKEENE
ncbi:hypothetical protein [Bacteroides intestinalis]|uniref:hypothetical protein n=1 Tax=Bacteroides intestinalis TaxID=329854 RepID=UPI0011C89B4F|nr:hypothetical protein [Bacteroides intestinalis]